MLLALDHARRRGADQWRRHRRRGVGHRRLRCAAVWNHLHAMVDQRGGQQGVEGARERGDFTRRAQHQLVAIRVGGDAAFAQAQRGHQGGGGVFGDGVQVRAGLQFMLLAGGEIGRYRGFAVRRGAGAQQQAGAQGKTGQGRAQKGGFHCGRLTSAIRDWRNAGHTIMACVACAQGARRHAASLWPCC